MKNFILLFALATILLAGCKIEPKATLSAVSVNVDGKALEKYETLAGTYSAELTKQITGGRVEQKLKLKSSGFWDFIGGFGVWYLAGGLFLLAAVIAAFFFKAYSLALSSALSGGAVLAGAFFLKLFWAWIAWAVALLLAAGIAYELWVYRKKLTLKNLAAVAKDLADNGKLDGSSPPTEAK